MARVTEHFHLGSSQGDVDFVDVDVNGDVPAYIDPTALRGQAGDWAESCVVSLQSFFKALLDAIRNDDRPALQQLVYPLSEPNETHLGDSAGLSKGRSLGSKKKSEELISALRDSPAVKSGFLIDLEDSAIMVEGIDKDIVSDITTCVIRHKLISYTQRQCKFLGIKLEEQESGPIWDAKNTEWISGQVLLPRANGDKLLLVPKSIVRVKLTADKGRYYRGYLRPYYEDEVMANPKVGLIRTLKSGEKRVNLKRLDELLGTTKADIIRNSEKYPQAFDAYKDGLLDDDRGPLTNERLADQIGAEVGSLRDVLEEIRAVAPGKAGATSYHHAIARLFAGLFTQSLGNERIEDPLHGGLKRIDITYDNVAKRGFFSWVSQHQPAAIVVVECKNYGKDTANPEFDQIAMRFSPSRGQLGLLTCRSFQNKAKALARARSIAADGHGYVLVLDDEDLERLIEDFEGAGSESVEKYNYPILRERFGELLSGQ